MNEGYLKVLKDGLKKLDSNYSGTKLNNILKKSFMLEEFKKQYDGYVEEEDHIPKITYYSDEDFPF